MNGSSPDGSGFRTKEEKKMMIAVWGRLGKQHYCLIVTKKGAPP